MRHLIITTLLLTILFSCSQSKHKAIHLVKNDKSEYHIIIPENATTEEKRAAELFNKYVKEISGCDLPVIASNDPENDLIISISKSETIESADGFSIKTEGSKLIITGGSARGCIYGVTEIIENHLGVKYLSPEFIVIPKSKNITLPAIYFSDSSPNTYRNVPRKFTEDPDYKDFRRLHHINDMFAKNYYVHTFNRLLPWQEYFKSHPEYFAFMNGKRIIDQPCLTNPDVFDIVIKKLEDEMKLQPEKLVWSVSQNDNFSYCQCDNCKKVIDKEKSAAGPVIHFVNRVAEHFPDKIISTLAYQYSRQAPVITKPHENVQVMLCTIELNRSKPIAEDPTSISFLKDMEDWGKICAHIYLWDYTVDFAHSISPFPNLHVLKPNIQLFVANNVKEHFQQSNTGVGHEFSELKSYLLSRLLWDTEADDQKIIAEFTDAFYGDAAPWIRKYISHMQQEILKTGEWLDIYGPPNNHQHTFLSAENIEKHNFYFNEAEKSVADKPEFLLHVRTARMPLQYAMMEIGKNDMYGPRGWYREENGEFIPRQNMLNILESFYQTSEDCNSENLNESGLTPEQYYNSTKRFIDIQVKGNFAFRKMVSAKPAPAEKYSDGNLALLTNGVRGANDYKVHWLGWESQDFSLVIDLEEIIQAESIEISTLYDPKSWILHPRAITCLVSDNDLDFDLIKKQTVEGNQREEEINRLFSFHPKNKKFRYVRFDVKGTLRLFDWHPSAGSASWVFVDEIIIK